jgi:hypothetical protein
MVGLGACWTAAIGATDDPGGVAVCTFCCTQVVDPDNLKGPIRLRLASSPHGAAQQPKPGTTATFEGLASRRKAATAAASQRSSAETSEPPSPPAAAAASAAIEAGAAAAGTAVGICVQNDTVAASSGGNNADSAQ